MRILTGVELELATDIFFRECEKEARKSLCLRKKGGSITVYGGRIISRGYNGPPGNEKLERCFKDDIPKDFKSDRTCCVHAEQRAIMEALQRSPELLLGSRIYYLGLDMEDRKLFAGQPYCTICSKMAYDAGVSEFVLWHEDGIKVYGIDEYNQLSFAFRG